MATPTIAGGVVYVPLVPGNTTAPAVAAADAHGCGSSTCDELDGVPLVGGSGPFAIDAEPYQTSVAEGHGVVGCLPKRYGPTLSQLISLGPSEGSPRSPVSPGGGGGLAEGDDTTHTGD